MSSDTPGTDARECEIHCNWVGTSMRACRDGGWVEADFARQLERELAAANAYRLKQVTLENSLKEVIAERDQLRAELARAKEDVARIDWMQSNYHGGEAFTVLTNGLTIRDAIDAAIEDKERIRRIFSKKATP